MCPLSRRENLGGTKDTHEAARKLQCAHASVCGFVYVSQVSDPLKLEVH